MEVLLCLVAVATIVFILNKTTFGFKLRLTGENTESAKHAGIHTLRTVVLSFVLSGGLAGLAGAGLVLGGERRVVTGGFGGNIGFTGIVVALVARNSPVGCIAAAGLFAALDTGGGVMQSRAEVPSEIILITQGVIVVLVAASSVLSRRLEARAVTARISAERDSPPPSPHARPRFRPSGATD
jgi:simple sugar transport system permease protein